MKQLKFEHHLADLIRKGQKTSTWRVNDDKKIAVNDTIILVDKVDPGDPKTWVEIGQAVVDRVVEKRFQDVIESDYAPGEQHRTVDELVTTFKRYYGPEVTPGTPVKMIYFTLQKSTQKGSSEVPKEHHREIKLYADGGSRGNPGPSASGFALMSMDDEIVVRNGVYLGITTNNQAEYQALKLGLEEALRYGAREVHVYMDSLLVINQMLGIFKVKNRDLWPIYDAIKEMVPKFKHITFAHVPRELNKVADKEVNIALDKQLGL